MDEQEAHACRMKVVHVDENNHLAGE